MDIVPPPLHMKWKQTFAGPVVSSPAIVGSRVYVGTNDCAALGCNFYAIDAATGNIIWSFNDHGAAQFWYSSPAVATVGGATVIFVGNDNNFLYAIRDDGNKGELLWAFTPPATLCPPMTPCPIRSSPAVTTIAGTQVVIFGNDFGQLWALVAATGAPYPGWPTNPFTGDLPLTAGPFTSSPAILGSTILIGNDDNNLYAVNLGNGVMLWQSTVGGSVISSPAVAKVAGHDLVFFGADDNTFYALLATSGALEWSQPVGGIIRSSPAVATIPSPPLACSPGPTLAVIFGSDDGNTYAMRASDGTPCWTFPSTGLLPFRSSPIVSGETVYIGSNDHNIYAIDINTGTWQWSFPATGPVGDTAGFGCPNPSISGDPTLYFGSNTPDNKLYAFQGPVATTTSTSATATSTTASVTQTSTVSTVTTTTMTVSTITPPTPPGPVPGFPIESIIMGLVGGLVALTLLERRRRRQPLPA